MNKMTLLVVYSDVSTRKPTSEHGPTKDETDGAVNTTGNSDK